MNGRRERINANKYRVDLSYPEAMAFKPDESTALLLLSDYSGRVSELDAVSQYIFQKIMFEKSFPDVSEALLGIAVVEMEHLELLGGFIRTLGVVPEFYSCEKGKHVYWNACPKNVDYTVNVKKALLGDINIEMKAIKQYEKHIEQTEDEYVKCALRRIILDEQLHIDILSELYIKHS
ncbi:MAG: ferritin family protein [Bacillota bacterium]|nr:ferritin family protein [Bacillota bacterium]